MSHAADALRKAIEHEKLALERYREAINACDNDQTRAALKKIADEKNQQIDSLHWMIMAEAGQLDTETAAEAAEEAPKSGASKCPFSGALAEMGIDITKMSKEEAMAKMGDMSKIMGFNPMEGK
jgi:hypothetical protein